MDEFRKQCEKELKKFTDEIILEKSKHSDLAFPCFNLAKKEKKNPLEIAQEISKSIKLSKLIKKVEAQNGYVNFYADWNSISKKLIGEILAKKENYGRGKKQEKIMLEYSGPNSNKPLHIGHLRNDSIGMATSNILEFTGYKILRSNIINDRGVHICKVMYAYKKWGNHRNPIKEGIKPDHFIGDLYVLYEKNKSEESDKEVQIMLQKWEKKDKETRLLWKKINSWCITGMKQTYKKFGSKFDLWPQESQFYDKAKPIIDQGLKKGIFFKNDRGDIAVNLEPSFPNKVVLRADGTSIYFTNDLALTKHRFQNYKINKMIWCVASEQNLYFQQLFKTFELLGYKWSKNCYHLSYGIVNLPSGRMKSREGNVIDADDLIEEVTKLAKEEIRKREEGIAEKEIELRADSIALAAIKYYLLKVEPIKDLLFIPEKAISFEGDTGPYLQYTYARAKSILRKSGKKPKAGEVDEKNVVEKLSEFKEIIDKSSSDMKSSILANYLFDLATAFNEFYHREKIIGSEKEEVFLGLVEAVSVVLAIGLKLLGIKPLERM